MHGDVRTLATDCHRATPPEAGWQNILFCAQNEKTERKVHARALAARARLERVVGAAFRSHKYLSIQIIAIGSEKNRYGYGNMGDMNSSSSY